MGLSKQSGKFLLMGILIIIGLRMLTKPELYLFIWSNPATYYASYITLHTPDAKIVIQAYGGAILLFSILFLLKVEEVGEMLFYIILLGNFFVYNPFSAPTEEIFQVCLANLALMAAILILMDGVWEKIATFAERARGKRK
ncbi:unnamed protein product [Blepharisma stoltei]|uniref:Uncharacterized protein n=1 Tax=Blepharisma stoltei TaxID=1481888 RepID=A0AAU9IW70_9CILI|nr:unnamed protein product [Blepharisma stoltei]